MQLSMYLTFFTDKIWVFGTKSDANVVFFPQQPALLGATNWIKTLDNPHAFTVHGVAFNGARRARGVQVDPLATTTLWNVECTYRKHSLEDGPQSNMDGNSSEQQYKGLAIVIPTTAIIFKCHPFVFAHYHSPCQDSKKCSGRPPKIQDRAYFSLVSLSPRTHSRRGKQGGRRARGAEADPRRKRSKK